MWPLCVPVSSVLFFRLMSMFLYSSRSLHVFFCPCLMDFNAMLDDPQVHQIPSLLFHVAAVSSRLMSELWGTSWRWALTVRRPDRPCWITTITWRWPSTSCSPEQTSPKRPRWSRAAHLLEVKPSGAERRSEDQIVARYTRIVFISEVNFSCLFSLLCNKIKSNARKRINRDAAVDRPSIGTGRLPNVCLEEKTAVLFHFGLSLFWTCTQTALQLFHKMSCVWK